MSDALFWGFAAVAVIPAIGILCARSIVRMAFLLLASLAGFALLYLHIGAGFVGFTQVLVYIGGILILFLFGVMLTARVEIPVRDAQGAKALIPSVLAGLAVMGLLLFLVLSSPWKPLEHIAEPSVGSAGASTTTASGDGEAGHDTRALGLKLLSTYVLPFEVISVLLLAAMVGATYMARGGGSREKEGDAEDSTTRSGSGSSLFEGL